MSNATSHQPAGRPDPVDATGPASHSRQAASATSSVPAGTAAPATAAASDSPLWAQWVGALMLAGVCYGCYQVVGGETGRDPSAGGLLSAMGPLEADAIWSSQWDEVRAQQLALQAQGLIEAQGWRCDSVSNLQAWVTARGYDVHCNGFRHSYQLEDQGGTWVARLD